MDKLSELKILVIGDIMLDKYVIGNVERISPEAPVQVVDVTEEFCTLGGCGNVAKNLSKIGVQTACIAACGNGTKKDKVINLLRDKKIGAYMVNCRDRLTTVKERIIAKDRSTQLLRIDRENKTPVSENKILGELIHVMKTKDFKPNIILISDYNKGVITRNLMRTIESIAFKEDITLIIDPKPSNEEAYNTAWAITPNYKEYKEMKRLESNYYENIIVTQGSKGVFLPRARKHGDVKIPAEQVEVFNVTGAGDSFVAIFSICAGLQMDVIQAARIANKCAAHVVTKPGTSSVPLNIFKSAVKSIFPKGEYF